MQVIVATLPQCASFRSLTGAADANAAAEFVKQKTKVPDNLEEYFGLDELEATKCWALVCTPIVNPYRKVLQPSSSRVFAGFGRVVVLIARTLTPTDISRFDSVQHEEDREFENKVGDLIGEMIAYVDDQQTLGIRSVEVTEATVRVRPSQRESRGNLQFATLLIDWEGLGG